MIFKTCLKGEFPLNKLTLCHHTYYLVFSWPVSLDSSLYALVFTKLLYPLNNIAICCSIGLTVAISLERCCKWNETQTMSDT